MTQQCPSNKIPNHQKKKEKKPNQDTHTMLAAAKAAAAPRGDTGAKCHSLARSSRPGCDCTCSRAQ